MRKLFEISSEEKQRILEMHESATKKNYLSEQTTQTQQQTPANNTPQGIEIPGRGKYFFDAIKDEKILTDYLNYKPSTVREVQTFCQSGLQCPGLNMGDPVITNGKKNYPYMMAIELAPIYLDVIAQTYNNQKVKEGCSDSGINSAYWAGIRPKVIDKFKSQYGYDDKLVDELEKYFGTVAKYSRGLNSAIKQQLNKIGACAAKPNPEQRSFVGLGSNK